MHTTRERRAHRNHRKRELHRLQNIDGLAERIQLFKGSVCRAGVERELDTAGSTHTANPGRQATQSAARRAPRPTCVPSPPRADSATSSVGQMATARVTSVCVRADTCKQFAGHQRRGAWFTFVRHVCSSEQSYDTSSKRHSQQRLFGCLPPTPPNTPTRALRPRKPCITCCPA